MSTSALSQLGAELADIRRQIKGMSLPSLADSSIEAGAVQEYDLDGVLTGQYGRQYDGTSAPAVFGGPTPPTPGAPTLRAIPGGGLEVTWNGLWEDPAAVTPMNFARVEVHLVPTSALGSFDPMTAVYLRGTIETPRGGSLSVLPLPYVEHTAILVARTLSGKASLPSATAAATPSLVTGIDLATGAVGFDQLAFKQLGNLVPDGSFESQVYRDRLANRLTAGWSLLNGSAYLGTWSLRATPTATGTFRSVSLTGSEDSPSDLQTGYLRAQPTERYLFRMKVKTTGANGSLNYGLRVIDATGASLTTSNVTYKQMLATDAAAGWTDMTFAATMPAGAAGMLPFVELRSDASAGTWDIDIVEVRAITPTALIDDLAVTSAKIALLAVNDANIGSLAVGKLITGTLTATVTLSGTIMTAASGQRLVIDSTGLKAYDSTGTPTVSILSTGAATFTGTITGSTITGGTIRTATTGARVQIDAAGGFVTYDSTNSPVVKIYADDSSDPLGWDNGMRLYPGVGMMLAGATSHDASIYKGQTGQSALVFRAAGDLSFGAGINLFENGSANGDGGIRLYTNNSIAMQIDKDGTTRLPGIIVAVGTMNNTATGAANMVISSSSGQVFRSTSLRKFKSNIKPIGVEPAFLELRPVTFHDKAERRDKSRHAQRYAGFIAEEVEALGLDGLVSYALGEDGEPVPMGLQYDRFMAYAIPILAELWRRSEASLEDPS